jgi:hypothetical protein
VQIKNLCKSARDVDAGNHETVAGCNFECHLDGSFNTFIVKLTAAHPADIKKDTRIGGRARNGKNKN